MPTAALPRYLGDNFEEASPGLRFGMCFQLWGVDERSGELLWTTHDQNYRRTGKEQQERQVKDENKTNALNKAALLNPSDRRAVAALTARQHLMTQMLPEVGCCSFQAKSVAPFATGLGIEHPLENGFAFLNPYGLPYLPGSSVKGIVRAAAGELASGEWGETYGWHQDAAMDTLFGGEPSSGNNSHYRGTLTFWDVIPTIEGDRLAVEIMTPHQTHYYQDGKSPHDSGSPNPIPFLTVPAGSSFAFHVTCDHHRLLRVAPNLARGERWKDLLRFAFEHAFDWLGFGAKTAVGYGAMRLASQTEVARCDWVEDKIKELATAHRTSEQDTLRGRALANAWSQIEDPALKNRVLADIKARWEEKGWWDDPQGRAARAARNLYAGKS